MTRRFDRCAACLLALASLPACGGAGGDAGQLEEPTRTPTTTLTPESGHDNQVQINAALKKGGVVYLKAGTYVISDTIAMTSGSTLTGDRGAIVELAADANWPRYKAMIEGHSIANARVTGFEVSGNGPNNTNSDGTSTVCGKYFYTMLYFTDANGVEIDRMYLHDNWNDIFKLSASSNMKFHDNTVRREGHDVVYAIHSSDVWVYNNDIKIACNSGVRPDGTKNIYIYANTITRDGGGNAGIEIQGQSDVWDCNNDIYGLLHPAVENLSGAPVHTSGCPTAGPPQHPPAH